MESNEHSGRTEQLAKEVASYVNMRIDAFKLNMVENLSLFFSSALGLMLFAIFASMAMLLFTAAFTYWLGVMIGSMTIAILLVGVLFLIIAFLIFALRHRLIADQMVRMFSRMFFNSDNNTYDDQKKQ